MADNEESKRGDAPKMTEDAPRFEVAELLALLRRDLGHIERELGALNAESAPPVAKEFASAAADLRDAVGGFLEKVHTTTEKIGHEAGEQSEKFRERIERHPMAAVSSAFALGYFLGRTVFRKHRHAPNS